MRVGLVTIIDTRPFLLMNYKTVSHANLITIYWWRTDIAGDNINQKGSCRICFFSSPSLLSATRPPIDTELYLFMWVLIGGRLQRKYDISNRQKLTMNEWASQAQDTSSLSREFCLFLGVRICYMEVILPGKQYGLVSYFLELYRGNSWGVAEEGRREWHWLPPLIFCRRCLVCLVPGVSFPSRGLSVLDFLIVAYTH